MPIPTACAPLSEAVQASMRSAEGTGELPEPGGLAEDPVDSIADRDDPPEATVPMSGGRARMSTSSARALSP